MEDLVSKAIEFIKSINEEEINCISEADHGEDIEKHKVALKKLIFEQNGVVGEGQGWYPYEVIELRARICPQSNVRVFLICQMIIAISIISGCDGTNEPENMMYDIPNGNQLSDEEFEFITDLLLLADKKYEEYYT